MQDAVRDIRHDVTVEHTGDVVEDVAEEMRPQIGGALRGDHHQGDHRQGGHECGEDRCEPGYQRFLPCIG